MSEVYVNPSETQLIAVGDKIAFWVSRTPCESLPSAIARAHAFALDPPSCHCPIYTLSPFNESEESPTSGDSDSADPPETAPATGSPDGTPS